MWTVILATESKILLRSLPCRVTQTSIRLASHLVKVPNSGTWVSLIKKKIKFSSFIRKSEWSSCKVIYEEGLPHTYMMKCVNISPYMRRPLVIYDFATAPSWISLYMRKILFPFWSVLNPLCGGNSVLRLKWKDPWGQPFLQYIK
jgi:hypothetical protein